MPETPRPDMVLTMARLMRPMSALEIYRAVQKLDKAPGPHAVDELLRHAPHELWAEGTQEVRRREVQQLMQPAQGCTAVEILGALRQATGPGAAEVLRIAALVTQAIWLETVGLDKYLAARLCAELPEYDRERDLSQRHRTVRQPVRGAAGVRPGARCTPARNGA